MAFFQGSWSLHGERSTPARAPWGRSLLLKCFGQLGIGCTPQQVKGQMEGFLSGVVELATTSAGASIAIRRPAGHSKYQNSTSGVFRRKLCRKTYPQVRRGFSTKLNVLKTHKGPKTGFRCIYQPLCDPALGGSGPGGCSPPFNPPRLSR